MRTLTAYGIGVVIVLASGRLRAAALELRQAFGCKTGHRLNDNSAHQ
jgi:hypothetical protein